MWPQINKQLHQECLLSTAVSVCCDSHLFFSFFFFKLRIFFKSEYNNPIASQIKKAKHCSGQEHALDDALETVRKGKLDSSRSSSKKSSLTSVLPSVSSSLCPSVTQACSRSYCTVSSEACESHPKDTAIQVTISEHHENESSTNSKQLRDKCR